MVLLCVVTIAMVLLCVVTIATVPLHVVTIANGSLPCCNHSNGSVVCVISANGFVVCSNHSNSSVVCVCVCVCVCVWSVLMVLLCVVTIATVVFRCTGTWAFTATTSTPTVNVEENKGADLKCTPSADFGPDARVEWKFQNIDAKQVSLVIYNGKPTERYEGRVEQYSGGLRFSRVNRKDTGLYICAVAGNGYSAEAKITLTVLVPPSVPLCRIPSSVKMGSNVKLVCTDTEASPPATYRWYKNNVPMPTDPSKFPNYSNMSYKLNPNTGTLVFPRVSQMDEGQYFCESTNSAGPPQRCVATKMAVYGVNTGGIVAGVIILLILLALLIVGLWFAHRKGYLTKMKERVSGSGPPNSAVYRPTSDYGDEEEVRSTTHTHTHTHTHSQLCITLPQTMETHTHTHTHTHTQLCIALPQTMEMKRR
ncbi:hypothetical protein ACEWY4_017523 [Coilia grayii]|uniref:Junctional adhesion molecule A n=1 Tax=Coilia grayii TaxID=363190 RepID=A0ABD1JH38_9TELE